MPVAHQQHQLGQQDGGCILHVSDPAAELCLPVCRWPMHPPSLWCFTVSLPTPAWTCPWRLSSRWLSTPTLSGSRTAVGM